MHLTLLAPELIWPEPGDTQTLGDLPVPSFAWLDGHAAFLRSTPVSFEKSLLEIFALPDAGTANFRRLGETPGQTQGVGSLEDAGYWLCADPVHLRFHQERIVLADAGAFDLDDDEAHTLIAALNGTFSDIGSFHFGTARRWYLRLNAAVDHLAKPLSAVAGRRMDGELDDKTSPLHRWLNEVQMFLHLHPINEARATAGKPAINSLWLWGNGPAGTFTPQSETLPDAVFSADPLARGLARAAGIVPKDCPATPATVLNGGARRPLVVLDQLLPTVLYENPDEWRRCFMALEAEWFSVLRGQLGKTLKNLVIIAPTIYGRLHWQISAGSRWKFWKSGRGPQQIAQALADSGQSQPQGL